MDRSDFITLRGVRNTTSVARCRTGGQFAIGAWKGASGGGRQWAYEPEVRSLEFESQRTHEPFNGEVKSKNRHFVIGCHQGSIGSIGCRSARGRLCLWWSWTRRLRFLEIA